MITRNKSYGGRTSRDKSKVSDILDQERLAKILGVITPEDFMENIYSSGHFDSEEEEQEAYKNYKNALESVGERLFGEHGLTLVEIRGGRGKKSYTRGWKVVPTESWSKAAASIVNTINGVGQFEFNSLREFLESGPYTERQAVLSHLGWIRDWPRVYGSGTAESMLDRAMRGR